MFRTGIASILIVYGANLSPMVTSAQTAPDFKQVYDLLRSNLPGVSEADLNRAAVAGLLDKLGNRARLLAKAEKAEPEQRAGGVTQTNLLDGSYAYVRLGRLTPSVPEDLRKAYSAVAGTNRVGGLVLDLRYADGDDYAAAAKTAGLFLANEVALADWGGGLVRTDARTDALEVPVVALVNRETAGAPELLAELIRHTRTGLVVGQRTAGQAAGKKDFALANGDRLRIATTPIKLGDGTELSLQGIEPDISVPVDPLEEKAYYADPFGATASTNAVLSARRARFSEADLVRERRGAMGSRDPEAAARKVEPEQRIVYDPVLARSLDLLKGLALVKRTRS